MEKLKFIMDYLYDDSGKEWSIFKLTHRVLVERGGQKKFEYWDKLKWF